LFGYQSVGLLTVICWLNIGAADDGNVVGVMGWIVCTSGGAVATTLPVASTIWVVSVTCWGVVVSLSTLVCTWTTAELAVAVLVVDGTSDSVAT